jgi:pyrroline-5-carboxylate reductase
VRVGSAGLDAVTVLFSLKPAFVAFMIESFVSAFWLVRGAVESGLDALVS